MPANREYKSSVFNLLFSDKEKLVELYNAIENTEYNRETEIEITTLEKVLYMEWYNDISFTIDGRYIVLFEHQSTLSDNLPLRFLIYISRVYEKLMDKRKVYQKTMVKIPCPEFYVLYNGVEKYPAEGVLKLSDAFLEDMGMMELKVKVFNINYQETSQILHRSQTLNGYSYFVDCVRTGVKKGYKLEDAIELGMKECIRKEILKDFLQKNGSEVINMLYTEFNMEEALQVREDEGMSHGLAQGREQGRQQGKLEVALNLLDILDDETIAEKTGLSIDEVKELREYKNSEK